MIEWIGKVLSTPIERTFVVLLWKFRTSLDMNFRLCLIFLLELFMFIEQQHAQDSGGNYLFISGFKFNWYVFQNSRQGKFSFNVHIILRLLHNFCRAFLNFKKKRNKNERRIANSCCKFIQTYQYKFVDNPFLKIICNSE